MTTCFKKKIFSPNVTIIKQLLLSIIMSTQINSKYFTRSKQLLSSCRKTPPAPQLEQQYEKVDHCQENKRRKKVIQVESLSNDDDESDTVDSDVVIPVNFKLIYDNIVQMRSQTPAAVDTMGCEKCFDENIDPKIRRFQVLVSLMLSSQTKDQITFATMLELKKRNLSVDYIDTIPLEELQHLIKSVGFFRRKAEYLKKTAFLLKTQYNSDIPRTLQGLMALPGVGPKMAHLAMKVAWNEVTGIAVDTHVHRICNRLKWVNSKTPEQTQKQLEKWLPHTYWNDINHMLVGFGQSICLPVKPKCGQCLNREICPASQYSF